jgi:hypothetical protein
MLRPIREIHQTNIDFFDIKTSEAGGIVCFAKASGIDYATYVTNPSGSVPVGLKLNDLENVNFSREPFPQRLRTTDIPCGTIGIATEGDFETDFIRAIGPIFPGDKAYLGPSGLITNSTTIGADPVGTFLSVLKPDPHLVTIEGLGYSREFIDPGSKKVVMENDPADRRLANSDGYIKVRIKL